MQRHVGIYSGTFDPVHIGHVAFARATLETWQLDEVLFLPEHRPRNKTNVTSTAHRMRMLEDALEGEPSLRAAALSSPQFTVKQTLPEIQQLTHGAQLTLLMGSDVVQTLPYWDDVATLLQAVTLAIGIRTGDEATALTKVLHGLPVVPKYAFIHTDAAHIASSVIRTQTKDLSHIHTATAAYIQRHRLYD